MMALVAIDFEPLPLNGGRFTKVSGVDSKALGWVNLLSRSLLSATIGNIILGVVLRGMIYWDVYIKLFFRSLSLFLSTNKILRREY